MLRNSIKNLNLQKSGCGADSDPTNEYVSHLQKIQIQKIESFSFGCFDSANASKLYFRIDINQIVQFFGAEKIFI